MKNMDKKYIIFLLISGVIFFVLNRFTPLCSDDWHYNFIYGTLEDIDSVSDVIKSQYIHYFEVNGRFIPHFIVQLFDGLLGKELFNIFNSFAFVLFLFLCSYTLKDDYKTYYISSLLVLALCFYFMPSFKNCFLWMSGACNYLWVANLLLFFNALFFSKIERKVYYPLLFITGIISGWTNEALVIGLGVGYFVYFCIRKIRPTTSQICLLSGFYIGAMFLVFSPGSIHRALGNGEASFNIVTTMHSLVSALLNMDNIRLLPIFVVVLLYSWCRKKIVIRQFVVDNIIWIAALIVTFLFILFTRHDSGHSRFGFELFSLILILRILSKYKLNRYVVWTCCGILIMTVGYVLDLSFRNYREYRSCMSQIEKSEDGIILTNEVKCSPYFERFIVRFIESEASVRYNGFMNQRWIANRYRRDSLFFIPQKIYTQIKEFPDVFEEKFYTNESLPFYVMKKKKCMDMASAVFVLDETNYEDLPVYLRFIAPKFEKYRVKEILSDKVNTINILGPDYYFVGKNYLVDNRVKSIRIDDMDFDIVKDNRLQNNGIETY